MTDFPVPTGREEAWRFTPTRRLRGLFEPLPDGGDGKVVVDVDVPDGVTVEHVDPREDARVGSVFRATERVAALAFEGAHGSKANVKCDALLVDTISRSDTYPYVDVREDDVSMGHEATVSKVGEDQLFYLMSRGLAEDEAMAMVVRGFVEPIARELPMEYALELNRLIELQMEGAVG